MFTSRAEYRLLLRQDNADRRLMKYGHSIGLVSDSAYNELQTKENLISEGVAAIEKELLSPRSSNGILRSNGTDEITEKERAGKLLRRPEVTIRELLKTEELKENQFFSRLANNASPRRRDEILDQIEIEISYEGYIRRQEESVVQFEKLESLKIPQDISYGHVRALSAEAVEKFSRIRPESIGQASRISGITPSDVNVLMVYLKG